MTLVELMMVVAIIGILALVGPPIIRNIGRFFILSNARSEIQAEARSAVSVMTRTLREAQSATIRIDRATGQPYYSRITFTKIQGSAMSFYQSGTNLVQLSSGTVRTTLSKNLKYLAFTFPRSDDMTIVSVSMTLEKAIYEGQTKALHMASEKVQVMN